MICYLDRAFCAKTCGNMECVRNQKTIDWDDYNKSGLPLAVSDCSDLCKLYQEPE